MDVALPPPGELPDFVLKFLDGRGLLGLRARVAEVRIYGVLSVPAPLVGAALLHAATGEHHNRGGAIGIRQRGVAELELDPLDEVLWRALIPIGWRIPARTSARVTDIRV